MIKYLIFNEKKKKKHQKPPLLIYFTCAVIYKSHKVVTRIFMCECIGTV